jgi:3-oxoacyl-[acyl-carrier protein] reductase
MITANLQGRKALVTGGASGIGLAAVAMLAGCGATVALNHLPDDPRGPEQVQRMKSHGLSVIAAPGNVGSPGDAERMILSAIDAMGGLDYLINNAGTPAGAVTGPIGYAQLDRIDEDFWQAILTTNLVGPFRCAKAAAPALKAARGAIVNTASAAAMGPSGSSIPYSASKAGLVNLTTALARALAPEVRVNAVAPGFVDSPWTQVWSDELRRRGPGGNLMGRLVQPEEIAEAMLYFCAGAAMVTGQTLLIDGGKRWELPPAPT